jgi:hypothetical protein
VAWIKGRLLSQDLQRELRRKSGTRIEPKTFWVLSSECVCVCMFKIRYFMNFRTKHSEGPKCDWRTLLQDRTALGLQLPTDTLWNLILLSVGICFDLPFFKRKWGQWDHHFLSLSILVFPIILNQVVDLNETWEGSHNNEVDLDAVYFKPVTSTISKWRPFRLLRWIRIFHQSTWEQ